MGTEGIIVKHGTHFYHLKLDTEKDTLIAMGSSQEKKGRKTVKQVNQHYYMHVSRYADLQHFYAAFPTGKIRTEPSSEEILTHILHQGLELTKTGEHVFHSIPSAEMI